MNFFSFVRGLSQKSLNPFSPSGWSTVPPLFWFFNLDSDSLLDNKSQDSVQYGQQQSVQVVPYATMDTRRENDWV